MGTMNSPPPSPNNAKPTVNSGLLIPGQPSHRLAKAISPAPGGINPYSIRPRESLPAKPLPAPMPRLERRLEPGLFGGFQLEDFLGEKREIDLHQRGDEEESGVAPVGAPEVAVGFHDTQVAPDFAEDVEVEFSAGIGGRHFGNAEAGQETDGSQRRQNHPGPAFLMHQRFRQPTTGEGPENDADEGE